MSSSCVNTTGLPVRRCLESDAARRTVPGRFSRSWSRTGFTLVEMLVAMALSLLIVLAVTRVFRLVGDNVLAGRAVAEMSGQLRGAADRLQNDLDGLTVSVRPWPDMSSGMGYFEYHEGPFWDMGLGDMVGGVRFPETSMGDIDDVLMFTARSETVPFVGQVLGTVTPDPTNPTHWIVNYDPANPVRTAIESRVAEIAWFTRFNDLNGNRMPDPGEVTLHRRALLVLPNLDFSLDPDIPQLTPGQFYAAYDVSVSVAQTAPGIWTKTANSLQDLNRRENRIAHFRSGGYPLTPTDPPMVYPPLPFPYRLSRALLVPQGTVITPGANGVWGAPGVDDDLNGSTDTPDDGGVFSTDDLTRNIENAVANPALYAAFAESYGNDVMLSQALAFDVKAYDPTVVVEQRGPDPALPGDPGYLLHPAAAVGIGQGGYVDLFYGRYVSPAWPPAAPGPGTINTVNSVFSGPPQFRSGLLSAALLGPRHPAVYDTWSLYYEQDGINQDGAGGVDQGTNGFDDNNANGVDDVGERETSPPYPVALRGIQVRLRLIDTDTRQVRQVTVTSDFIPE